MNSTSSKPHCRFCNAPLTHVFADLGTSPLCESYIKPEDSNKMEPVFTLKTYVCDQCYLVQLEEFVSPGDIFSDYAYFSSYSTSWLKHACNYSNQMVERFGFNEQSLVGEIASNDGYLLQYFVEKNIPVLGIEPAANVAEYARKKGVRTEVKFFGVQTAKELVAQYGKVDLLAGNNVLAHVPDLNDFVGGIPILLKEDGVLTMEFPHLLRLMEENQFDTIYHEHFSYFSFTTVKKVFDFHGITLFDVEEIPTHGGSLRIYGRHHSDTSKPVSAKVTELLQRELEAGVTQMDFYKNFEEQVKETKRKLLEFLIEAKRNGKRLAGYGAPGKGNTLLNYCGIRTDFIDFTVDRSPHKQGSLLPGTRIPIYPPEKIDETKPDYVLILPWNLKEEIMGQMSHIRNWGGQFVVPIPEVTVYA
ncbi:class I SAM-dependent methyltransferase [Terrimonas pollutisoli]|uniref:class I SAM-dependent methyltransferase n=1 Tax=Terrimonas pollutisoli TaxID=3034147 RepID=UPI0023EB7853|nr:class I SAM-dependent methyltransferase [Terrimonas sp. H1YJ31]